MAAYGFRRIETAANNGIYLRGSATTDEAVICEFRGGGDNTSALTTNMNLNALEHSSGGVTPSTAVSQKLNSRSAATQQQDPAFTWTTVPSTTDTILLTRTSFGTRQSQRFFWAAPRHYARPVVVDAETVMFRAVTGTQSNVSLVWAGNGELAKQARRLSRRPCKAGAYLHRGTQSCPAQETSVGFVHKEEMIWTEPVPWVRGSDKRNDSVFTNLLSAPAAGADIELLIAADLFSAGE